MITFLTIFILKLSNKFNERQCVSLTFQSPELYTVRTYKDQIINRTENQISQFINGNKVSQIEKNAKGQTIDVYAYS